MYFGEYYSIVDQMVICSLSTETETNTFHGKKGLHYKSGGLLMELLKLQKFLFQSQLFLSILKENYSQLD